MQNYEMRGKKKFQTQEQAKQQRKRVNEMDKQLQQNMPIYMQIMQTAEFIVFYRLNIRMLEKQYAI